jgi:hypothetical protein
VNFLKDLPVTLLSTFLGEPKDGQNGRCLALRLGYGTHLLRYIPKDQLFADDGRKGLNLSPKNTGCY